ncbi:putative transposase [Shigella boydii 965-58]|nr:putative transposase [Shigella boydii 965-58]
MFFVPAFWCDGRSIPLLSKVVPSEKQNNPLIQHDFLDSLAQSLPPDARVIIVTDAGFQSAWFHHITSTGLGFYWSDQK